MKKRGIWVLVSVLVALGLILASCAQAPAPAAPTTPTTAPAAPAKVIKVQTQAFTAGPANPRWPLYSNASSDLAWLDFIERVTGGRIEFDIAPMDSIILWNDAFAGIAAGTLDMMPGILAGTYAGIIPEANVLNGLPLAWQEPAEVYDAFYQWGLAKEMEPLFHAQKVHNIVYTGGGFNALYIKGIADTPAFIKGKKIRAVGVQQKMINSLGGNATVVPYTEGYMALKLGTIDGWVASPIVLELFKFDEVLDSIVMYPTLGFYTNGHIWNLDFWNSMPEDLRDMIDEYTPMFMAWFANVRLYLGDRTIGSYFEGKGTMKVVKWTEAEAAQVRNTAYGLWDGYAKESANMARLVDLVKRQVAALGRPPAGYKAGW